MPLSEKLLLLGLLLIASLAFTLNLGLEPLFVDESIRAGVAVEMINSGNYIVPTLWGEFYYRKPPLFNWILTVFFQLFGYSEFWLRIPSVISAFLLSLFTWKISRNYITERGAILAGFGLLLSSNILLRDAMLGYIDLTFSLITCISFFAVYSFYKRGQFLYLFVFTYLLAAIGTLMKGMPSILFQGFTIGAWFVYHRNWKKLFSLEHFLGISIFITVVGGYFWAYSRHNSLETYFSELYGQASMRTVAEHKWYEGIYNLVVFPLENAGFLFPISMLFVFAFRKGMVAKWLKNDFTAFVLICLAINIIPYWLSPGYRPRYILMLYPLLCILGCHSYILYAKEELKKVRVIETIFLVLIILFGGSVLATLFIAELHELWYFYPSLILLIVLFLSAFYMWFRKPIWRMYWVFSFMILLRLAYDLYVIPYRIMTEKSVQVYIRNTAPEVLEAIGNCSFYIYGSVPIELEYAFYLEKECDQLITNSTKIDKGGVYIIADRDLINLTYEFTELYRFKRTWRDIGISIVRFDSGPSSK